VKDKGLKDKQLDISSSKKMAMPIVDDVPISRKNSLPGITCATKLPPIGQTNENPGL